jgi:hypothetical protein
MPSTVYREQRRQLVSAALRRRTAGVLPSTGVAAMASDL